MHEEILDVINSQNQVIGQKSKTEVHSEGLRHRVSAILLRNKDGKYLVPTASERKVEAGGLFHSAAGHVPTGETYLEAAIRELKEEAGLNSEESDFEMLGSYWLEKDYLTRKERERFEVFLVKYREEMGKVRLNDEQNNEKWLSDDELSEIYSNSPEKMSFPLRLSCQHILFF